MDNHFTIAKQMRFSTLDTSKAISCQHNFLQSAKSLFAPPSLSLNSSLLVNAECFKTKFFLVACSVSRLPNSDQFRMVNSLLGSTKAGVLFLVNGFTYLAKAVIASGFDYISASFAGFKHTIIIPLKGRYG